MPFPAEEFWHTLLNTHCTHQPELSNLSPEISKNYDLIAGWAQSHQSDSGQSSDVSQCLGRVEPLAISSESAEAVH